MTGARTAPSRRDFLSALGGGAALVGLPPVFAAERLFAQPPGPASADPVHLNFNENPYGPSPKAIAAIRAAEPGLYGRYFDDDSYETLSNTLAAFHKLKRDNIHVGAGSTEILKICDDVFLGGQKRLVVAEPAYEAVLEYAANSKAEASKVPLTPDHRHDLVKMAAAITPQTGMVYLCNPNNPTATIVHKDELSRFMDQVPRTVTVVVDEAYAEFVTDPLYESAVRYVREGRNVVVAKTFSKIHGLAGMRVGYAIGPKEVIDRIKAFTVDYAITGVAVNAAMASLADTDNVRRVVTLNLAQRQIFLGEMAKAKFSCAASQANFVMVDIRRPVDKIIPEFTKRKVLVGRAFPAMPNFLRVTLGTDIEMQRFYAAFHDVLR